MHVKNTLIFSKQKKQVDKNEQAFLQKEAM